MKMFPPLITADLKVGMKKNDAPPTPFPLGCSQKVMGLAGSLGFYKPELALTVNKG